MDMSAFGKWIIIIGLFVAGFGLILWLAGKSGLPFGGLPGDISVERPGFSFRFPLMTSIVLSIIITIVLNFLIWFFRK